MKKIVVGLLCTILALSSASNVSAKEKSYADKNFYVVSGVEGALLQLATWQSPTFTNNNGKAISEKMIPRFTYFFNMGADYNYQIDKNVSLFTGLSLKNIGLIIKLDSIKNKHRVYTLGTPLGIRIHSADRKVWFKTGLDLSWAIHYKAKQFVNNKRVNRYSEWFSDKSAYFLPSAFAGLSVGSITLSTNVYLDNFFNPYNNNNLGYEANLVTIGLGVNLSNAFKTKKIKV